MNVGGEGLFLLMILIGLVFVVGIPLSRAGSARSRAVLHDGWQPVAPAPGWEPPSEPALPAVTAADVSSLRDRLGHDVRSLEPGHDPVARQAMADASERYGTASTLLGRAGTDAQLRTAWLATVEGLAASQVVRQRLGLPLGPPPPSTRALGQKGTSYQPAGTGRPPYRPPGNQCGRPGP